MDKPADFELRDDGGVATAVLTGDWTAVELGGAPDRLAAAVREARPARLDLTGVGRCDTSGAWAVLRASKGEAGAPAIVAEPSVGRLIELVRQSMRAEPPARRRPHSVHAAFERIGRGVYDIGDALLDTLVFNGHLVVTTGRAMVRPAKVRWAAVFSLAERSGLDAMPIVALTTFFIGAVVGLLGANLLSQFGAKVFSVELVGIAVLREFNVLITALLLAGRSASSFAAEIGAMKMNQEIDAMRVLGVDPFDALVFPRFLALLITIPLLVFVATLAGLAGGLAVTWPVLGISPTVFLQRLIDNVGITHFWVGLSKAPVLAVVIAGIGCRQGLEVGGDVESLGRRVTAAVVHAIFATILIDAIFALIYMELNV